MASAASPEYDIAEHIIPLSYVKFVSPLSSTPEKVNFVQEYGGFNLACGTEPFEFGGKYYNVFCLRYITPKEHANGFIPGNMRCEKTDIELPKKDMGVNFVWNNWGDLNLISENYVFLGQIDPITGNILQVKIILNRGDADLRLYRINFEEYKHICNYILCPREYMSGKYMKKYKLISLRPYIDESGITDFNVFLLDIDLPNLYDCGLTDKDWNLPIYKSIVQDKVNYYDAELFYFKWYENKCVVEFSLNIQLPTYEMLDGYFKNTHGIQDTDKIEEIKDEVLEKLYDNYWLTVDNCKKTSCGLRIGNKYLIGNDFVDSDNIKLKTINTHGFSMGTHFINVGDNTSIAVGHIKIISRKHNEYVVYADGSKPIKIQEKIYQLLTSLFGYTFKQNHSAFPNCNQGYSYLSYFIKYNDSKKTYHISDFFLSVDMSDKYHFSLLNTFGIMKINEHTYITSGEGDYYNSIMKFKTSDIVSWCKYDALAADFTIDNMNYLVILKDLDGELHTIVIDDQMVIDDIVQYHTEIKNTVTGIDGTIYGPDWRDNKKIYLKLREKYGASAVEASSLED
jgi:hypothetical protein